jgi:hypothetical protein
MKIQKHRPNGREHAGFSAAGAANAESFESLGALSSKSDSTRSDVESGRRKKIQLSRATICFSGVFGRYPSALPGISPTSSEIGWGDASVISSV